MKVVPGETTPGLECMRAVADLPREGGKPMVGKNGKASFALHPLQNTWLDPVDGAGLLSELEDVFRRFVRLPTYGAEALALWVVHTYAFELREVSTYIGVESPEKRCGKTTLLGLLAELAHKPVAAANISAPALFRMIEEVRPTLIIDEADTFLRTNDELRGILNSGYTRTTAFVVRVTHQKGMRLARFSCWCPKVMACIGRLPDSLADRCIKLRMERKLQEEECQRLRELKGEDLRRKCARFVADNMEAIRGGKPEIPGELNDREADIWEPLFVLADLAGDDWGKKARQAAKGLTAAADVSTPGGALLLDVFVIFTDHKAKLARSRDLVEGLNELHGRPWAVRRRGARVTEKWLANQLALYGVRPRNMRAGETIAKGYVFNELRRAWKRYITPADLRERNDSGVYEAALRALEVGLGSDECEEVEPDNSNGGTEPESMNPALADLLAKLKSLGV